MSLSNRILASLAVLATSALIPASAQAGTVSVENVPGTPNVSRLVFTANPGEQNQIAVIASDEGAAGVPVRLVDAGAPLTAGTGCTGGGVPGAPAYCRLHPREVGTPEPGCSKYCMPQPGTSWTNFALRISLGDENDSYDGSSLTESSDWAEEVEGGSGDDTITTGGRSARITPGPGNDTVHGGPGQDTVIADAVPDGNDVLDLGTGTLNYVDDSARPEPLHLANHVLGAAGEEDHLGGFLEVVGGSGNDEFAGAGEWLLGGPGNDTLVGSAANDIIWGGAGDDTIRGEAGDDRLYGGEGNDTVEGGAGNDLIEEFEEVRAANGNLGESGSVLSGGNDRLSGGEGDDFVLAGPGEDTVDGGPGNDTIYGEADNDAIEGGLGDDVIAGEGGADVLNGGEGNDRVLAGRVKEFSVLVPGVVPVDTSRDQVDCGPGRDVAQANGWDQVKNCETRKTIRAVKLGKIERNRKKGSALVTLDVAGAGSLHLGGAGAHPVGRKLEPREVFSRSKVRVVVRAIGPTREQLRQRGHVTVVLQLFWQPEGQPVATETRKLRLVAKKGR
jgi:Ca2+-binding RTX toxin-like protein